MMVMVMKRPSHSGPAGFEDLLLLYVSLACTLGTIVLSHWYRKVLCLIPESQTANRLPCTLMMWCDVATKSRAPRLWLCFHRSHSDWVGRSLRC